MRLNISERVNKHRASLRAAGLRPIQIWVPDTRVNVLFAMTTSAAKVIIGIPEMKSDPMTLLSWIRCSKILNVM